MLSLKNKAGETPLDVCRNRLSSTTTAAEDSAYQQRLDACSGLLELAEQVQADRRGLEDGGEKRDLFASPCPEAALLRSQLTEAIDSLESVTWNVLTSSHDDLANRVAVKRSNSTGTNGQEEFLSKLIDRSFSSFRSGVSGNGVSGKENVVRVLRLII